MQCSRLSARSLRSGRFLVLLSLLLIVGCQQEPTTVSGLVTLDGRPLTSGGSVRGTVVFHPASEQGPMLSGLIDSGGKYQLAMGSSMSVAPGDYWVTVSAVEAMPPTKEQPEPSGRQITPAKYASAADSGLQCRVVPGLNKLDLALKSEEIVAPSASPPDVSPAQPSSGNKPSKKNKQQTETSSKAR
jgi:hypothetical protein